MKKTIFITGASRGFGRIWAEAFLNRGDQVVATSRNIAGLGNLVEQYGSAVLPLELDITDRSACVEAISKATAHFGKLDVVINNAGMGVVGMVEELTESEAKNIMEANFFGTLWITQAAIPVFRKQGSGHIIQLSSALGIYTFPSLGIYSASKFAVEGLSEALHLELKALGIYVTIVEPNGFATAFNTTIVNSQPISAYAEVREQLYSHPAMTESDTYGNPAATAAAILKLVDAPTPPLRLILGKKALPIARTIYQQRLETWEKWNDVSVAAHG